MPGLPQLPQPWSLKRPLLVAGGLTAVILLTQLLQLEPALTRMRSIAAGQGVSGMVGFGVAYTIAALLFVPGAALTLMAGGLFGVGWGAVVVVLATSAADATSFLIGRYLARGAVKRLTIRYPRFGAVDQAITAGGWRVVALLRLSPTIPYSASNYLYGLTGIPFIPYLLSSGVFTLPWHVRLPLSGVRRRGNSRRTWAESLRVDATWERAGCQAPSCGVRDGARPKSTHADRAALGARPCAGYHPHVRPWFCSSSHVARGAK